MPIGNPVTLTSNVASKTISVTATASQTLFNVTGGYRINELGVFKNGLRLQDGVDYTARDGLTVTLLSAASGGDKLQFVVFDTFRVAEAIRPAVDEQTIRGNLNVVGILSATNLEGPISINITSGIQTFHDVRVGGALTVAGSLTYEDTTNTNTTGIATFSGGMNISGVGATVTTLNVTGISTFAGNINANGNIVGDNSTNISGINQITATTFSGDGSGLTGVASTDNIITGTAATFNNTVSIADSIFHVGDTNTAFGFPAADTFTVYTAGSERVRVDSSGNVGINQSNPDSPLEVVGTGPSLVTLHHSDGGTNDEARIMLGALSGQQPDSRGAGIAAVNNGAGHDLTLKTSPSHSLSPTEKVRITSAGRVGVGSDSPNSILDAYAGDGISISNNGDTFLQSRTLNTTGTNYLEFKDSGGGSGAISYHHNGNSLRFKVNGSERIRIADSGEIGLGGANYGTSGQVLTSNGSGSAVTWEDASGGGGITTTKYSPAANAVIQIGLGTAQHHELRLSAGFTTVTTSGGSFGESHSLVLVQPSSGICTVGFSTFFQFPSGATPSMSEGGGKVDLVSFVVKDIAGNTGTGATELLASAGLNYQ